MAAETESVEGRTLSRVLFLFIYRSLMARQPAFTLFEYLYDRVRQGTLYVYFYAFLHVCSIANAFENISRPDSFICGVALHWPRGRLDQVHISARSIYKSALDNIKTIQDRMEETFSFSRVDENHRNAFGIRKMWMDIFYPPIIAKRYIREAVMVHVFASITAFSERSVQ